MARPHTSQLLRMIVAGLVLTSAAACSTPPEQQLLKNYFLASRVRDNVTLGNIATVGFNPTEQGTVENFTITNATADQVVALKVKELSQAVAEAQKAQEAFSAKKREFQDANIEAIGKVIKAEAASAQLKGKDLEVQQAWTKWRQEEGDYAKKLNEARSALTAERSTADVSLQGKNVDLTQVDADITTREVSLDANVKTPQGATEKKSMVIRLQKASAKGAQPIEGKWLITGIK
ncbi:MAG: hypothetical protein U0Q12_09935 [Vicinamibacterales bacterium]